MRLFFLLGVVVLANCVSAGELSDSISFGGSLKGRDALGIFENEILSTKIGTVNEVVPCVRVNGDLMFSAKRQPRQTCAIQIQEVYPPESPGVRYTYEVYANDQLVYVRDYPGAMFGKVSYFIYLDQPELTEARNFTLRLVNRREEAFRISAVWVYSSFEDYLQTNDFDTPYYLVPLLKGKPDDPVLEEQFRYIRSRFFRSSADVRLAFAQEHHYMNRDEAAARKQFEALLSLARKYNMPLLLPFVSWWSGTPRWVPDGKGGTFSDPEYQQVCWSETDDYDEGEELKSLLGDKWDVRYGWTAPNQWSNTPWLTMNHPRLNQARHEAIARNLAVLADVQSDYKGYLLGLVMENEPRYWDLKCPDQKYPVERKNLWADFNPVTVADAARDGVTVDPSDGLDYTERLWLHENVARYQQETYDAHESALRKLNLPLRHDIYSHAFPGSGFPMGEVTEYHPLLEWNRLRGCANGVEYDFRDGMEPLAWAEVAREWGRWSQINYEENNGIGLDRHLRALRVCYAFGARHYVFYNWQSINREDRWAGYVRDFCKDGPRALVYENVGDEASYTVNQTHSFSVSLPTHWPTANEVNLTVDRPGVYTLKVYDGPEKDRVLGFRSIYIEEAGTAKFALPNCIPVVSFHHPYMELSMAGGEFGLLMANGDAAVSIYSDSHRERLQSLLINWRADAQQLIEKLRRQRRSEISEAERLFSRGEYVKAFEAAVRIDE